MAKKTESVEKLEDLADVEVSVNQDLHQVALLQGESLYDTTEDQWVQLVAGWAAGRPTNQNGAEGVLGEAVRFADLALVEKERRFPSSVGA